MKVSISSNLESIWEPSERPVLSRKTNIQTVKGSVQYELWYLQAYFCIECKLIHMAIISYKSIFIWEICLYVIEAMNENVVRLHRAFIYITTGVPNNAMNKSYSTLNQFINLLQTFWTRFIIINEFLNIRYYFCVNFFLNHEHELPLNDHKNPFISSWW